MMAWEFNVQKAADGSSYARSNSLNLLRDCSEPLRHFYTVLSLCP